MAITPLPAAPSIDRLGHLPVANDLLVSPRVLLNFARGPLDLVRLVMGIIRSILEIAIWAGGRCSQA